MNNYSLRRRLIIWISLPILSAILLATFASYLFAQHEIEEVYDAQLVHSAKFLLQLTQHEILKDEGFHLGIENPDLQHRYERNLGFRIWVNNKLLTQSTSTESFSDFEAPPGFSYQTIGNHDWRFFVFIDPDNKINIEVSERNDIRNELIINLMESIIFPSLIFIPAIFFIVWIGVRKVLKPVVKMSNDMDNRNIGDFSPIPHDDLPQEIAPLVLALNRLFLRIAESFNRERQFTDNAAHELRTPLAAMKTQAQVLLKKASEMPECREGLENLHASVDRASHMVDQLLSFARLQGDQIKFNKTDLSALIGELLKDISPLAVKKKIDLEAKVAPELIVNGNKPALTIMLRNLIENAIKFTPAFGNIVVSATHDGDKITLKISDTGEGINDKDKEKVFERFYRVQKNIQGSGLGLSMAKWVCDAHGANISLSDNIPSGLIVTVSLQSA